MGVHLFCLFPLGSPIQYNGSLTPQITYTAACYWPIQEEFPKPRPTSDITSCSEGSPYYQYYVENRKSDTTSADTCRTGSDVRKVGVLFSLPNHEHLPTVLVKCVPFILK